MIVNENCCCLEILLHHDQVCYALLQVVGAVVVVDVHDVVQ